MNNITIIDDEADEVRPKERALKSTNNTAGKTMTDFLTDNGQVMFLGDTGLDVDAMIQFLSKVNNDVSRMRNIDNGMLRRLRQMRVLLCAGLSRRGMVMRNVESQTT
jgi:hypothetical protein